MSPFNFETFGAGHIPPFPRFVFDIKEGKSKFQTTLSEDIEDVEYFDVSDPQPEPKAKQSYDKTARDKEIADQASEFVKKRSKGLNPMVDLFVMSCFIHAAKWTDDHPLSSFGSSHDQYLAIKRDLEIDNDEIYRKSGQKVDSMVCLLELSTTELARRWANENPPKYY